MSATIVNEKRIPLLEPGDRLTRDEFERRYSAMPNVKKAELIDGVVYMPSPVRLNRHGKPHSSMNFWLATYRAMTPLVEIGANSTVRLDMRNEPQPDVLLMIANRILGNATISIDDYVEGAPELVAEISASSVSFDLHTKFDVYRRVGVKEYIVWRVEDNAIDWFVLRDGNYEQLPIDADGMARSEVFPGLWLDVQAMLRDDMKQVLATLNRGLATPEQAAFVARLSEVSSGEPNA